MKITIERVSCDFCGQVFEFERTLPDKSMEIFEDLSEHLRSLGWLLTTGGDM